jgi:hypothetical protein
VVIRLIMLAGAALYVILPAMPAPDDAGLAASQFRFLSIARLA